MQNTHSMFCLHIPIISSVCQKNNLQYLGRAQSVFRFKEVPRELQTQRLNGRAQSALLLEDIVVYCPYRARGLSAPRVQLHICLRGDRFG